METVLALFFVLMTLSSTVFGASESFMIKDAELGTLRVQIIEIGEPIYQPLKMRVSVLCKDRRLQRNLIQPTWQDVMPVQSICDFRPHHYDSNKRQLTLHFTTSEPTSGQAKCDAGWSQNFNFSELCSAWRN